MIYLNSAFVRIIRRFVIWCSLRLVFCVLIWYEVFYCCYRVSILICWLCIFLVKIYIQIFLQLWLYNEMSDEKFLTSDVITLFKLHFNWVRFAFRRKDETHSGGCNRRTPCDAPSVRYNLYIRPLDAPTYYLES